MKIGWKLNLSFMLITVVLLVSTIISVINLGKIENKTQEALDERVTSINLATSTRFQLTNQGLKLRQYALTGSEEDKQALLSVASTLDENVEKLLNTKKEDTAKWIDSINEYNEEFNEPLNEYITALENGEKDKAMTLLNKELFVASDSLLTSVNELLDYENEQLTIIKAEVKGAVTMSTTISITVLILSVIVSTIVFIIISRVIVKPLKKMMESAKFIAEGDLTQQDIEVKSKDEIGQLGTIFNDMKDNLRTLMNNLKENAESLSQSSQGLSASTEEVTATTDEVTRQIIQVSEDVGHASESIKESAIAMDETANGVQNIVEASQRLNQSSIHANETALNGKEIIENAQRQMMTINDSTLVVNDVVEKLSSKILEIENISKQITTITEQTNLLALNASIEAARAGDAGKGFAVVADEVKKLAEQSKNSASSIGQLTNEIQSDALEVTKAVKDSLHSVENGVTVITTAGKSFENILNSITLIKNEIQEVSSTSEQLSASAEEVSASVSETANSAESTSNSLYSITASMEEQTAIIQELNNVALSLTDNAQNLEKEINKFKIN